MTLRFPLLVLSTFAFGLMCWSPKSSFSHGGPPTTHDVLFVSGQLSLVTSHGLFAQERDWEWVCEEAISREKATRVVRTAHRWFVATITGLRASDDACHWKSIPALLDRNILGLAQDMVDSKPSLY